MAALKVLIIEREKDNVRPQIKVWKYGPFFEVEINGVNVGKVMKLTPCYCTATASNDGQCSGYCLNLKNNIVVLSDDDELVIREELRKDDEEKQLEQEFKDSIYVNKSDFLASKQR